MANENLENIEQRIIDGLTEGLKEFNKSILKTRQRVNSTLDRIEQMETQYKNKKPQGRYSEGN